jgi:hypothetical protein
MLVGYGWGIRLALVVGVDTPDSRQMKKPKFP